MPNGPAGLAELPPVQVVVGAAIVAEGRVLAAQRAAPPALAGGWEFPGGKVEPGESDAAALVRECQEELGVQIAVGKRLGADIGLDGGEWMLRVWLARIVSGIPVAREHRELRWLTAYELLDMAWLPADLPLVAELQRLLAV